MRRSSPTDRRNLTRSRRAAASRLGAAAIEFAIVAQVAFVVVLGAIELSRMNLMRNLAQDAAYYAARDAMVPGATADEAEATAREILGYLGTQGAAVVVNNGLGITTESDEITVQVTVPVAQNALFVSSLTQGMNIVANATMRTERYDGYYDPTQ